MLKGYNSDLSVRGKKYHVQTEDWGQNNPFLVSRVFCNGAVVKTVKTSYQEALAEGSIIETEAILQALQRQHRIVIDDLMDHGN